MKFKDFLEFLSVKKVVGACPACGETGWAVSGIPKENDERRIGLGLATVGISENNQTGSIYTTGTPIITMECKNCAYTRIFNYPSVEKWVENKVQDSTPTGKAI